VSTPPYPQPTDPPSGGSPAAPPQPAPAAPPQYPPAQPQYQPVQQQYPTGPQYPGTPPQYPAAPPQYAPQQQPQPAHPAAPYPAGAQPAGTPPQNPAATANYGGAYPPHAPADPAKRRGNGVGVAAAILVALCLLMQLGATAITAGMIADQNVSYEAYGLITTAIAVVQGLVALAAVVLGAIGLARRDRPKGFAGIGFGGGAVVLVGILAGQLTNLLLLAFTG
jgi:hypothetical protein